MKRLLYSLSIAVLFAAPCMAEDVVLVDFSSRNCGTCQSMTPTLDALAVEGHDIHVVDVDVDRATTAKYGVDRVPTFLVFKEGREVDRIVGVADRDTLRSRIRRAGNAPRTSPRPAWRYEHPTGFRSSVVGIECSLVGGVSRGSGVLVRWGERIVVLTARHVIKDAVAITVRLATGRRHTARVLKVDATWDCAVLQMSGAVSDVQPAEFEWGQAAMQTDGARLESCGYGPDDKLAANSGLFLGYRRSQSTGPNGPDDWFVISGPARKGDSGGPVFNERGRVVGILWGTDGSEVVCVQAGRLHVSISEAMKLYQPNGSGQPLELVPVSRPLRRFPTPPMQGPCGPNGNCDPNAGPGPLVPGPEPYTPSPGLDADPVARNSGGHLLPYRDGQAARNAETEAKLNEIGDALRGIRSKMDNVPAQPPSNPPEAPKAEEAPEPTPTPLGIALCVIGAIVAGAFLFYVVGKN